MGNNKNILLTGGSGNLGSKIIKSNLFDSIISPSKKLLNISNSESIDSFMGKNIFNSVIHCAAKARMKLCQNSPDEAISTNIIGTSNLVNAVMGHEKLLDRKIRFIYISTDGVYASETGEYSENSATIPYNNYGWSKLGAECAVRLLSNYCIVRTRFFDPHKIPFDDAPKDIFTSSLPIDDLVKALHIIHESNFVGVVNIGDRRLSEYDRYKKYKKSIKICKRDDILKELNFKIAKDSSMNCDLWLELKE